MKTVFLWLSQFWGAIARQARETLRDYEENWLDQQW